MKPWRTWLACLGVVGALAIISGCGGGDVPDPGSDGQAAAVPESTPPPPAPAPAAVPAQAVAAAPKAAAPEEKAEEPRTEPAVAQAEPPAAAEKPAAEKPAGAAAGGSGGTPDRGSATAEMLALATKDQAPPAAGGEAAQGGNPGPGGSSGGPGGPGGPGGSSGGPGGGPPRPPGANGPPGAGGMAMGMQGQMQQQQMMRNMQANTQNQMRPGGPGGPGMQGMPGGPGSPGGPGGSDQPPDFRTPEGAVQAFLDALKAHDLDRLTEATALRAQTEASKKYQEMFKRIFDSTLSESELNTLASKLDGYKISGENQAKSTGRLGVILRKQMESNRGWLSLVITVRREKKGWGVCDISETHEFKNQGFGTYKAKKRG